MGSTSTFSTSSRSGGQTTTCSSLGTTSVSAFVAAAAITVSPGYVLKSQASHSWSRLDHVGPCLAILDHVLLRVVGVADGINHLSFV